MSFRRPRRHVVRHPLQERAMQRLAGKNVVVIGGSRGVGRAIVATAHAEGARVLAVARGAEALAELARALPGVATLALDAGEESAPDAVFSVLRPDVLVMCGGARPLLAPLHEQSWESYSRNWQTDVKASFLFCRAALRAPLPEGATVILVSSGAGINGSPLSGGYAGAKRTQMFMANYGQKESERLHLGLRFRALVPARIMAETEMGQHAVGGYAEYLGIAPAQFVQNMGPAQTAQDVANAVVSVATGADVGPGNIFVVSAKGVEPLPQA
jgi:NAD(P)-dependent dehydrogenase (short-subunit alcohol dehydrogenase family)